jgi:hypothetical protein
MAAGEDGSGSVQDLPTLCQDCESYQQEVAMGLLYVRFTDDVDDDELRSYFLDVDIVNTTSDPEKQMT